MNIETLFSWKGKSLICLITIIVTTMIGLTTLDNLPVIPLLIFFIAIGTLFFNGAMGALSKKINGKVWLDICIAMILPVIFHVGTSAFIYLLYCDNRLSTEVLNTMKLLTYSSMVNLLFADACFVYDNLQTYRQTETPMSLH